MRDLSAALRLAAVVFQMLFMALFIVAGAALTGYSIASALGHMPWLVLPLQFGETPPYQAGVLVQCAVSALVLGLAIYLPSNYRILKLETSHRRFNLNMTDIARAYDAVHRADREGVFELRSEFDAVRERMVFLRNHPDLGDLETDLLEVAAQMGVISHELAEIYSDEKVDRARTFLKQRQQEVEQIEGRLEEAKIIANDIHRWAMRVEMEEDVARSEIRRLQELLFDVLPEFNGGPEEALQPKAQGSKGRMIELPTAQAAE